MNSETAHYGNLNDLQLGYKAKLLKLGFEQRKIIISCIALALLFSIIFMIYLNLPLKKGTVVKKTFFPKEQNITEIMDGGSFIHRYPDRYLVYLESFLGCKKASIYVDKNTFQRCKLGEKYTIHKSDIGEEPVETIKL